MACRRIRAVLSSEASLPLRLSHRTTGCSMARPVWGDSCVGNGAVQCTPLLPAAANLVALSTSGWLMSIGRGTAKVPMTTRRHLWQHCKYGFISPAEVGIESSSHFGSTRPATSHGGSWSIAQVFCSSLPFYWLPRDGCCPKSPSSL